MAKADIHRLREERLALWELMGKLMFIMDSRFHGNDTNVIVVIPAKAGIHPMQDSFPRYLPKSQFSLPSLRDLFVSITMRSFSDVKALMP